MGPFFGSYLSGGDGARLVFAQHGGIISQVLAHHLVPGVEQQEGPGALDGLLVLLAWRGRGGTDRVRRPPAERRSRGSAYGGSAAIEWPPTRERDAKIVSEHCRFVDGEPASTRSRDVGRGAARVLTVVVGELQVVEVRGQEVLEGLVFARR